MSVETFCNASAWCQSKTHGNRLQQYNIGICQNILVTDDYCHPCPYPCVFWTAEHKYKTKLDEECILHSCSSAHRVLAYACLHHMCRRDCRIYNSTLCILPGLVPARAASLHAYLASRDACKWRHATGTRCKENFGPCSGKALSSEQRAMDVPARR